MSNRNVVEDCTNFLRKIKELKSYVVEFNKDGSMKPNVYPLDFAVKDKNQRSIMVITYDKYIFSTNDDLQKAWT